MHQCNLQNVSVSVSYFYGPDEELGDMPCGDWFVVWGFKTLLRLPGRPMRFYPNDIHGQRALRYENNKMEPVG